MKRLFLTLIFIYYMPVISAAQVPHYGTVIAQVAVSQGPFGFGDHLENCRFTHAVAVELHSIDPRFGLLNKRPGQNQCPDATAVDAVLYLPPTGLAIAVDIIEASDSPSARPGWIEDIPRYTAADWRAPIGPSPIPNPGPVVPTPPDLTPLIDALAARVAALEAQAVEQAERADHVNGRIDALQAGLDLLASRPVPVRCKASVLGIPVSCRLETP